MEMKFKDINYGTIFTSYPGSANTSRYIKIRTVVRDIRQKIPIVENGEMKEVEVMTVGPINAMDGMGTICHHFKGNHLVYVVGHIYEVEKVKQ